MAQVLFKKSYLTIIENSAKGENWMFRNFFLNKDGMELDVLQNGGLSCASLVSNILYMLNPILEFVGKPHWLKYAHATVSSTEKDMVEHGWRVIEELKPGAVLIWEKRATGSGPHEHIGFCLSETEAVSNDSNGTGFPWRHSLDYPSSVDKEPRKIEKIYWHQELENK
ncbi:MAG: hypothetical protein AAB638_02955 [Patescibacteria group bacterium]